MASGCFLLSVALIALASFFPPSNTLQFVQFSGTNRCIGGFNLLFATTSVNKRQCAALVQQKAASADAFTYYSANQTCYAHAISNTTISNVGIADPLSKICSLYIAVTPEKITTSTSTTTTTTTTKQPTTTPVAVQQNNWSIVVASYTFTCANLIVVGNSAVQCKTFVMANNNYYLCNGLSCSGWTANYTTSVGGSWNTNLLAICNSVFPSLVGYRTFNVTQALQMCTSTASRFCYQNGAWTTISDNGYLIDISCYV